MKFSTASILASLVLAATASPAMASLRAADAHRALEEVNEFDHNTDTEGQTPLVKNEMNELGLAHKAPMRQQQIFHDLVSGQCVADHKCATLWGDPHIVTFDGIKYDCMVRYEYCLAVPLFSSCCFTNSLHPR